MAYKYIIYEKKARIAYITINRPEVMNALHPPAHQELSDIWRDFRDDSETWVAILTGSGDKAFSAGYDIRGLADDSREGTLAAYPPGGFGGMTNRFKCWKPIIAAVNGYALGGGFEMALSSDIVVAAEHARFGFPEPLIGQIARVGAQLLPRHIPRKIAMDIILTSRQVPAQEAMSLGLVNEVVPMKELLIAAEGWAGEILKSAPLAVRANKQAAIEGFNLPFDAAVNNEYEALQQMLLSEDAREGPRAFLEKRKPVWKGR
jgi:enoyl-CoA hydratase/carnithine racemase